MPKQAFLNLPDEKRDLIFSVAIREFSSSAYEKASINQICRESNMAKGSFYQYFEDKLDLYVFVMTRAIEAKIACFDLALKDFQGLELMEQMRLLFMKGVEFAKAHPEYAALAEQFAKEKNERAASAVVKEGSRQSDSLFAQMIEQAIAKGEIDRNVDIKAFSSLLKSLNTIVNDYLSDASKDHNKRGYDEDAAAFVDSLLFILFDGVKPRKEKEWENLN